MLEGARTPAFRGRGCAELAQQSRAGRKLENARKMVFKKKKFIPVLVIALCKHFFYVPILFGWSVCNLRCALKTFTATEKSTARKNVYFWETSHCLVHLVQNTRVDERKERDSARVQKL